jgi:hypothetical protein
MRPYLKGACTTCRLRHGARDAKASFAVAMKRHCIVFVGVSRRVRGVWGDWEGVLLVDGEIASEGSAAAVQCHCTAVLVPQYTR